MAGSVVSEAPKRCKELFRAAADPAGRPYHMGVAAHVGWRRYRLRGRRGAGPTLALLAFLGAPVAGFSLAPVAQAQAAYPRSGTALAPRLLPSALPTVCVGGVVLCPGSVVVLPTPLPVPVPSACVSGVACTGDVVQAPTPTATATPRASGTATPRPGATVSGATPGGPGPGTTSIALQVLPAPPGVGLVPQPQSPSVDGGLSPDSFANLLALSLREGLGSARYHVWPWLLGIQLVLWTAIAVVTWSRQMTSSAERRQG